MPTHGPDLGRLTLSQLSRLTGAAKETVAKRLRAAGVAPVGQDGRSLYFDPPSALRVVLGVGQGLSLDAERAALAKAQREAQELKNASSRGELLPREDVVATWSAHIAAAKARLRALPKRLATSVPGFTRTMATRSLELIDEALNELADGGEPKRRVRRRRK